MAGPESKVGYIQTFLMQKIKINTVFIKGTNIKAAEALVIIKTNILILFFRTSSLYFSVWLYVILTLFSGIWHLF